MRPPALLPGDTIGVMAPSSYVEKDDIESAKALLEARGYKVFIHPQTFERYNQSAGTHTQKLDALHALYADKTIKAIWAAGGGNRALYLLEHLDYALIKANPKHVVGFSDVTALLNALTAHTGQVTIHGPVFKNVARSSEIDETLLLLSGKNYVLELESAQIIQAGVAKGKLVGGNLSLFVNLCGTKDCPELDGAILFLEDCGDEISRFDRMLCQLRRLGVFRKISGAVLGDFFDLRDSARPFGFSLKDIFLENLGDRDIPLIMDAPFGHGKTLLPLPIGLGSTLDTGAKKMYFESF
jgi:muramoyltetrapeptide carboxypeptidase